MGEVNSSHKWLQLPDEVVARYNFYDCLAAARAAHAIKQQLKANKQLEYFEREVWPLLPAVLAMQRRGLPYNTQAKGQYRKKLRKELKECDTKLRSLYKSTANYEEELAQVAKIEELVANPPEGKEGQKYRTRAKKGITLTKAESDRLGRRLPETWNPNSDDQVRRWLFEDLGLRASTSTAGGKPSVDMDALSRIYRNLRKKDEHARPALHNLMHRARLQKIDQDYLDPEVRYDTTDNERESTCRNLGDSTAGRDEPATSSEGVPNPSCTTGANVEREQVRSGEWEESVGPDRHPRDNRGTGRVGRVYPTIKMTGTENARFSYADPPVHSWPDEVRHLVEPAEGKLWLGADHMQVEARVFSILTNDTRDLEVYRRFDENPEDKEWDIHYRTACDLFGYTIGELLSRATDQIKGIRVYSKNFRYGVLLYGGGPTSTKAKVGCPCPKCIDSAPPTVSVTPKERQAHADRWFTQHPNVQRWREQISYQVMRNHTITTPLGRKRYFMAPWSNSVQREAWNCVIQTTAAEIIHRAMRKLHTLGCPLCLQHHDALYAEVEERDSDYWAHTMKTVMEQPVVELENRRFPVDLEIGPSWGEMRSYESSRA